MGRTKNSGLSIGTRGNPQIQLDNYDLQNKLISQACGEIVSRLNSMDLENELDGTPITIEGKMTFVIDVFPKNKVIDSIVLEICKKFKKNKSEIESILTFGGVLYKGNYTETIKKTEFLNTCHIRYKIEMVLS